eukprot:gene34759-42090_t
MADEQQVPYSPVPDPPIRTLKVELLSNNSESYVPCIPNARDPTPFETEFFKGIAMIIIRTKPIDPRFREFFEGRRRLFEVQVQGKFKREPAGEVFVGAEGSQKLELGIITRSISRVVSQFISTMVSDLHYSFGDNQDNPNHEVPHVVSPIFITFDKIVATPPGETPPPLGTPFPEDLEYRKKRLKFRFIKDAQVDLDTTYSFSVCTQNLDLLNWTIVGIPMVKPMDLRTYSGNGSVSLIGYEIPRSVLTKFPNTHPRKLLNYVFSMRLTPVNPDEPIWDLPQPLSEEEGGEEAAEGEGVTAEENVEAEEEGEAGDAEEEGVEGDVEVEESSDEEDDGDGVNGGGEGREEGNKKGLASLFRRRKRDNSNQHAADRRVSVSSWLKKKFTRNKAVTGERGDRVSKDEGDDDAGGANGWGDDYTQTDYELDFIGDLAFVPGCIECNELQLVRGNRRRFYYLFVLPASLFPPSAPQSEGLKFRIRSYTEISKQCKVLLQSPPLSCSQTPSVSSTYPPTQQPAQPMSFAAYLPSNSTANTANSTSADGAAPVVPTSRYMSVKHKYGTNEKRRRCMVENMRHILSNTSGGEYVRKLASFLLPVNDNDIHFLGGN